LPRNVACGVELTLSDGTEVTLHVGRRDFEAARAIHRNVVSLRRSRMPDLESYRWLGDVVYGKAGVLRIGDAGRLLQLDNSPTALGYTDLLGVHFLPESPEAEEETTYDEFDW
jgi:hypothetical protein